MTKKVESIENVKVGNCNYNVKFIGSKKMKKKSGDCIAIGLIDNEINEIYILSSMSNDNKLITLWHEIFHAILVQRCLDASKKIEEEDLVDNHAQAIIQIIRDNAALIEVTINRNLNIFDI